MKNIIRSFLIISILTLVSYQAVQAQLPDSAVMIDESSVRIREIPESKIDEFRSDKDFEYTEAIIPGKSILQMIRDWFRRIFSKLFETRLGNISLFDVLLYGICIAAGAYAVYKLLGMQAGKVTAAGEEGRLPYSVIEENIHEMDFEALIAEASDQHQYRRAIRLTYLYALKKLSDSRLISWEAGKTNHDYISELNDDSIKPGFGILSYYFKYAWYGEFEVGEHHYKKVRETFHALNTHLG